MHLPIQSMPVQRTTLGQPLPGNSVGQTVASPDGIQPSGLFDDIISGIGKVAQVAAPFVPALAGLV